MKTKKAGFTLVELLVVVAIIAVLMSILMPVLRKAREGAKRSVCANQCKQIGVAMNAYVTDYEGKLPWYGDELHPYAVYRMDGEDENGRPYWNSNTNRGVPMKLACLYDGKYIGEGEVLYCPSNRIALYKYKSYTKPKPWGSLPQEFNTSDDKGVAHNQWVRIGYTYYPTCRWSKKSIFTGAPFHPTETWEQLDPRIPYMTDIIRKKKDLSHRDDKRYAVHGLFKDGHVAYCNDQTVFSDPVWDELEAEQLGGELRSKFYYRIFNLIKP